MVYDKKDLHILFELDKNARQSLRQLGKKVGLKKNVVAYRIKRLEEQGVIKGYYAVVDASKLGHFSIRFYLTLQNTTPKIEADIIEYFKGNPTIWWVASTEPLFDLAIIIGVKSIKEFYSFWEATLTRYGQYFKESQYSIYVQAVHYKYEYLLNRKAKEEAPEIVGSNEQVLVDSTELRILKIISNRARIPIIELARKASLTAKIVQYRMKKLTEKKVLIGFRANIDISKIGYQNYRVNFYFSDYSKKNKIESYIAESPSLIYTNRAVGDAHLECELHLKSLDELHAFIDNIKEKFPESIRSYTYFIFKKVHKEQFMPQEEISKKPDPQDSHL